MMASGHISIYPVRLSAGTEGLPEHTNVASICTGHPHGCWKGNDAPRLHGFSPRRTGCFPASTPTGLSNSAGSAVTQTGHRHVGGGAGQSFRESNPSVLYHGTSRARLLSILRDGVIRKAQSGPAKVALTDSKQVAIYWARLSADTDRREGRGDGEAVVVFVAADRVDAEPHSDGVWGDGECDWERERAVWRNVPTEAIVGWQSVGTT